jgi:glycine cleavage system H protein
MGEGRKIIFPKKFINIKHKKMDQFTYTNIFETKGIEYLAIISFFAILIPFWLMLNKKTNLTNKIRRAMGSLTAGVLRIPQGLFYSKNHTWTHLETTGAAKVGVDDLLLHITGEVKFRNLKNPGENINKGELMTEIDQNGKILSIFSPLSGKILKTNDAINENPDMLIVDPYGIGWIYKIKPSNWVSETNSYFLAEEATSWSNLELERFKDFLAASAKKYSPEPSMLILQDGGELRSNILSEMPKEVWHDFQNSFLTVSAEK